MSDSLRIWGTDYTGVNGFKAKDANGNTHTYGIDSGSGSTPSLQSKTVTPSESAQTITADTGYDGLSSVEVGAISGTYVGSQVARRSSSDLTASDATVSVPAGYYENAASKAVSSGSVGTPTATKGSVSNHAVAVTPSVTATGGYVSGGTTTGTPVTVTASELASGNKAISENGTDIDVVGYSTVSVAVPQLDTSDATAAAGDIVSGKSAYVNGSKIDGSLVIQHYYTGSSTPSSSLGSDGDVYLQTGG